ncbi:hypothetical protein SBDP1_1310017 [Syntrophobacter sp. SbD1]|nr:hypothetical protein SBDP1_1310017 [Syntrophobacter sp. SbD1]
MRNGVPAKAGFLDSFAQNRGKVMGRSKKEQNGVHPEKVYTEAKRVAFAKSCHDVRPSGIKLDLFLR